MVDLICVGECMIELARQGDGRMQQAYAGDTFNTAVYAARSGAAVGYATALGDDPYSDGIVALGRAEGVDMAGVARVPGRLPGLYMIETDAAGERSFWYWRDRAPVREFTTLPAWTAIAAALGHARMVAFSGITLCVLGSAGCDALIAALATARAGGTRIAFDTNYRPRGWPAGPASARTAFSRAFAVSDIVLPSIEDERVLWGDTSAEAVLDRLAATGIGEIALKAGPDGAVVQVDGVRTDVPCTPVEPIDTTAAGDSFDGAYLAARLRGEPPAAAARAGHAMAARVVRHRGAIIPRDA